jgi:hypothetical protein
LRHVYANVEKSKVDEAWKRKAIIKIPGYNGKRNDIQANMRYLRGKKLDVPIVYGKNIIIQGEIYFWAIFGTDERVKLAEKLSKEKNVDNGWEILTNSKFAKQKKELGKKNLLSTIPIENSEKDKKKEKTTVTKSQLRKEYEANTTESQKSQEEEVVDIVDQYRKGVLDVNAPAFTPKFIPKREIDFLESDEILEIVREVRQSTEKEDNTTYTKNETARNTTQEVPLKESSQQVISRKTVEEFIETNARCEENLQKVSEVKSERKRVNFKDRRDREDRVKFQAIMKK